MIPVAFMYRRLYNRFLEKNAPDKAIASVVNALKGTLANFTVFNFKFF